VSLDVASWRWFPPFLAAERLRHPPSPRSSRHPPWTQPFFSSRLPTTRSPEGRPSPPANHRSSSGFFFFSVLKRFAPCWGTRRIPTCPERAVSRASFVFPSAPHISFCGERGLVPPLLFFAPPFRSTLKGTLHRRRPPSLISKGETPLKIDRQSLARTYSPELGLRKILATLRTLPFSWKEPLKWFFISSYSKDL